MDYGAPLIEYELGRSPRQWGHAHGESFREGIKELSSIRRTLMQERNPSITGERLATLATEQWAMTEKAAPLIALELDGIAEGADVSRADLVILNNYTDFRDIQFEDQGCSTVYVSTGDSKLAGQTWDMHGSAKDFVAGLLIPRTDENPETILFTLIGCVGMSGVNEYGAMVGINNLSTRGAQAGILWPVLVRQALLEKKLTEMRRTIETAAVTSGHAYLIATPSEAEIWEITPEIKECVGTIDEGSEGFLFHTNHCVGTKTESQQVKTGVTSTTHDRFALLTEKVPEVSTFEDLKAVFQNHDSYPRSICSHFESNSQDPSMTCGALVADISSGEVLLTRGCETHDDNFKSTHHKLEIVSE